MKNKLLYLFILLVSCQDEITINPTYVETKLVVEGSIEPGFPPYVILTKNEVIAAKANYPNGALFIVSGIYLDRSSTPPKASLGKIREIYNWKINSEKLTAISYYYDLN